MRVVEPLTATGGLRVLFLGDTAGTGFGTVTRDLGLAMVRRGMDVRFLSMNEEAALHDDPAWPRELHGRMVPLGLPDGWVGINGPQAANVVNRANGIFTGRTIPGWTPEAVISTSDHGSLERSPWTDIVPPDVPCFQYVPIEGVDLPPSWAKLWKRWRPVAMCEFGADQIEAVMGERPPVIYHGIDPDAFWPVSPMRPLVLTARSKNGGVVTHRLVSKTDCREFLGWPVSATILFRADRLMPRKAYPAMLRALAPVMARHPEVVTIIHCRTQDQGGDLWHESSKYPDGIRERIVSTGFHDTIGGVPRELLTCMYNAADLYISTSAEGFGLTVAESIACGTPAVALGYSSLPEVVGPAGVLVDEWALIDNIYSYFWAIPKGTGYTDTVERLVTDRAAIEALGRLGPSHVARFDWKVAAERMEAVLTGGTPPAAHTITTERRMAGIGLVGARA